MRSSGLRFEAWRPTSWFLSPHLEDHPGRSWPEVIALMLTGYRLRRRPRIAGRTELDLI
jgi:hypothetical protein